MMMAWSAASGGGFPVRVSGSRCGRTHRPRPAAQGSTPVSFAIADRAAAQAWAAHFTRLGVRHSEIGRASRGWVVDVYDPDGMTVRLYSAGDEEDLTNRAGYARTP